MLLIILEELKKMGCMAHFLLKIEIPIASKVLRGLKIEKLINWFQKHFLLSILFQYFQLQQSFYHHLLLPRKLFS